MKRALIIGVTGQDGTPLMDVSRLRSLGWEPGLRLVDGLRDAYQWFVENYGHTREA